MQNPSFTVFQRVKNDLEGRIASDRAIAIEHESSLWSGPPQK
jgi:hypothetical protein